ncbi:MAG: hypothetical protein N0C90_19610, partial [Candidatus Thiodiazotropha endolucinida]|nr:hypothetical protein [Candidatus Thiodiazotropha taylori]MCW4263562.1 hypothetical protein [Candidatus Thiodiazotropha endolucinida]
LVFNVFGNDITVTLKVVNDSNSFVTFKKGKSIGQAESAELVQDSEYFTVARSEQVQDAGDQEDPDVQQLPQHLQSMYDKSISGLSVHQKMEF